MTKEQIVEIIRKNLYYSSTDGGICDIDRDTAADEIFALPIDVPTDEDIEAWADSKERRLTSYHKGLQDGAKAMRNGEILKRNNK